MFWTTATSVTEVLNAIRADQQLDVWWFAGTGQRFRETAWLNPEGLQAVRTESDDG